MLNKKKYKHISKTLTNMKNIKTMIFRFFSPHPSGWGC